MASSAEHMNKIGKNTQFKPGHKAGKGRPKLLKNVIKDMKPDTKEKIGKMFLTALSFQDDKEAAAYLKQQKEEGGCEFGIVLEMCIKGLQSNMGWKVLMDIYCILFGTPRQSQDVTVGGSMEHTFKFGDE